MREKVVARFAGKVFGSTVKSGELWSLRGEEIIALYDALAAADERIRSIGNEQAAAASRAAICEALGVSDGADRKADETINRVLQRVISNFAGVLVGDVFDNGCKSKPFFASGWVGWQLTTPAGDTRIHVGISLSESDETHDISGFVYQGDSPDLHSAEHALDHYIDVYRG